LVQQQKSLQQKLRMTSYNLRSMETASTQKMKAVRFANDVEHIESDVIRGEDTAATTWFTSSEMRRIGDREAGELARQLSGANNEDTLRAHGLESEYGRKVRKIRVRQGQLCVLLAQEELWEKDEVDPELIARIYSEYTKKSARAAHKSGVICELQIRYFMLKEDLSRNTIMEAINLNATKIQQGSGRSRSPALSPASSFERTTVQTMVSRSA
jgi:hypothetical protein